MTRLSDSLRGLADRAPVDGAGVSASAAARRIYRGRRLRAVANATAGVGVVTVIALAAINPGMGAADSSTANAALPSAQVAGGKVAAPGFDASGASQLAWGQCGTSPFDAEVPAVSNRFSVALGEIGAEVDQGTTVKAALTVTRSADVANAYQSQGANFMVLWDGVVVGTADGSTLDPEVQSLADGTAKESSQIDLVNCWDGTPLPAGNYTLVAYEDFYLSDQPGPTIEPTPLPVDPTLAPVEPTATPGVPIPVDGGVNTTATIGGGTTSSGAAVQGVPDQGTTSSNGGPVTGNTGVVGPAPVASADRAVSNTVKLVIAGDVPKDPFGAYLTPAAPAVVHPADYLTPASARDEYTARATTGTWDMAAGSQRVVRTGDSLAANDQNAWTDSYYGCSADGTTVPSFPATSADWPLLAVDATLPGSVGVSYGWVVDGNPEVKVSVKNISGHTLPGFWGQPNTTMYLVKDGKVVATSFLAPTDPNATSTPMSSDGLLAPGTSLSGTYLWRDVNGCWMGSAQVTVTPGTYTVLMEQDVYLDNGNSGSGGGIAYLGGKSATGGGDSGVGTSGIGNSGVGSTGAPSIAQGAVATPPIAEGPVATPPIAEGPVATPQGPTADAPNLIAPTPPADGSYDWLSLQVWTSLGAVTVK
ncbi:hypothetical protein [Demequina lutea]|uniref:Uncharacterized protein n=1 Tax=Demequina lutea TaxID=431489 RepID=A0A7Y9Z7J7_9MICO|nr:hypothetical protein [Demequina lutea]NYI40287.1 hypothetical protein [Demequina lutea]